MSKLIKTFSKKIKIVYRWYQEGQFWRQVKIKLFARFGGFKLFFPVSYFVKINNHKVVCVSYSGIYHAGNPAYIADKIREMCTDAEIVWLVDQKKSLLTKEQYAENVVDFYSFRAMYELASARIWIDNARKSIYVPKKDGQFYLQTWHGGVALKKVEGDAEAQLSHNYIKIAKLDTTHTDLMLSNSRFCTEMYRRAFWYDGEILEKGLPRNDFLFHHPNFSENQVKEKIGVRKEHKLLLYAPTFRKNEEEFPYIVDFSGIIDCLERKLETQVTVIVKHHPNIRKLTNNISYKGRVVDATDYPDIQELYLISDFLITDYSSTMFEFSMLKKPVFLYINDWENYKNNDRGFYFDFEELPFAKAYSMKELLASIHSFDINSYDTKLEHFFSRIGLCESGAATDAAASYLVSILKERMEIQ